MSIRTLLATLTLACAASAQAQDYSAMIQQSIARQNSIVNAATQRVQSTVQQRMQDPQVQASYQQYLWRMQQSGQRAMDFPTYTYQYIYTRGFSAEGTAFARANEAGIAQREAASLQAYRQAQAARGAAQQAQRDSYFANQQEAGRGLMGQSTYVAPNGAALALPHTWQANSTHQYQGQTYGVDASGNYHVLGANGGWYPLQPRR